MTASAPFQAGDAVVVRCDLGDYLCLKGHPAVVVDGPPPDWSAEAAQWVRDKSHVYVRMTRPVAIGGTSGTVWSAHPHDLVRDGAS